VGVLRLVGSDHLWQRLIPSWPWLVGLAVFARLVAARTALLQDPDTYLHIAAGRWIWAHGALPLADPFSHSMPGARWLSTEWLAQLLLAALYDTVGWSGLIVVASACVAGAVGLLTHFLLRRYPPLPALVAALAAAGVIQAHALARPHVLALPLLVLWSGALFDARDAGRPPPLLLLLAMVLWANLHGSFMAGLALALFLAGEAVLQPAAGRSRRGETRRWGGFVVVAVVAALLTPHGPLGLLQSLRLMAMPVLQSTFAEWLSPDFQKSPALELWLLGALLVALATGVRPRWTRIVLLLGLVHMTLQHARHGDVLVVVAPLALAGALGQRLAALSRREAPSPLMRWVAARARPSGIAGSAVGLALAVLLALPLAFDPVARGDDRVTPAAALDAAGRLGLTGPVFNSEGFGGYLLFRGVPSFIDGRAEMYGNDFLGRDYRAERGDAAALADIVARYQIAWTLLLPEAGAVGVFDRLAGWQRVYGDDYAVIHRRMAAEPR
jgi:uncharacterized membrane protein